jgi:alkylation response protein AidB-like acyl-CoA dehydrogenase
MIAKMNPELKPFEDLAASFAEKELAKKTEEHDRYPFGKFFSDVLDKAFEVGLFGVTLPEDMGGIGQSISALCLILDRICQADSSLGGIVFTNAFSQEIMISAKAENTLKKNLSGSKNTQDALIASCPYCNPAEIRKMPKAKKKGASYVINGELEYLVLGGIAEKALIPARTNGSRSYSFFLIDLSDKTVQKSPPVFSLGLHACPAVDLELIDTKGLLIGEEGKGQTCFLEVSSKMHAAAAAMSLGVMKGSLEEALAYSNERFQGGREIINWSEIGMIIANMAVKVNVADLCVAQACQAIEKKSPGWDSQSVSAALLLQEMACELTTDGVQVLGGNGYMKDYGQEKRFRDAKQLQALMGIAPRKKLALINKISAERNLA